MPKITQMQNVLIAREQVRMSIKELLSQGDDTSGEETAQERPEDTLPREFETGNKSSHKTQKKSAGRRVK